MELAFVLVVSSAVSLGYSFIADRIIVEDRINPESVHIWCNRPDLRRAVCWLVHRQVKALYPPFDAVY
jgi:hypothetical protein